MEKLLSVKNLKVSFNTYVGEVRAVRGVDFELHRGETLAFVGESGCGKTVTAKALMRLLQEPFGTIKEGSEIVYRGEDVLAMDKKRLQQYRGNDIAMIFQDPMTSSTHHDLRQADHGKSHPAQGPEQGGSKG